MTGVDIFLQCLHNYLRYKKSKIRLTYLKIVLQTSKILLHLHYHWLYYSSQIKIVV
ncbi:Uncharacterized protein dnm_075620 [Desulfonema magnum]|uniref:Uncharacterized protein n=1 Tax=Desulfonema magnum TaxID=45655 RepID=A0A975BUJ2_9BACT|nr:Uncharacterized protein dnm_075620 [Desulfonema magnum]